VAINDNGNSSSNKSMFVTPIKSKSSDAVSLERDAAAVEADLVSADKETKEGESSIVEESTLPDVDDAPNKDDVDVGKSNEDQDDNQEPAETDDGRQDYQAWIKMIPWN
jgi:hypothetical protein